MLSLDLRALEMIATDVWAALPARPDWLSRLAADADARRVRADYDTGSILEEEAYLLWALAESTRARVVIEVGTFIGTSTHALAMGSKVEAVYTCDISNDCLPGTHVIRPYPKVASQDMLQRLCRLGVTADLCFFDGVLRQADADALTFLTHPGTVYAFHDYNYGPKIRANGAREIMPRKGIGNVRLLIPKLPMHVLVEPRPGTTLALLVPA